MSRPRSACTSDVLGGLTKARVRFNLSVCLSIYVCVCVYTYRHTYIHTCVYIYTCMYVCMYDKVEQGEKNFVLGSAELVYRVQRLCVMSSGF